MEDRRIAGHKKIITAALLAALVLALATVFGSMAVSGRVRYYVTQYSDITGLQAMFYTIESTRGDFIVIDGGNVGNEEFLWQVIDEKGGHVDAWILTHPHPDHVGAFNGIWDEIKDKVDRIYTIELDYDAYKEKAREWDGFGEYERFLANVSRFDRITYLHKGDEFDLCGLQCRVFSAYDAWINVLSGDLCNDGSLMFRIANRKESMLFCSDVGLVMSDTIIGEYGDELKCTYIQMGHHGNGGLSERFYRLTEPKGAFFDAPEWLMNPAEGENYTTPANRRLMESMGAEIFYYSTSPNRIELK